MKKISTVFLAMIICITAIISASAASIEYGDVDENGRITSSDARTVLRAAAQLETLTDRQMIIADVNMDEKVSASDARLILRIAAKLDSSIGSINPDSPSETATEEPATETPAATEPTTAELTTEVPTTTEPTTEAPVTTETTTEEPTTEAPAATEPTTEEPTTEEPTTEASIAAETTTEEPATEEPVTTEPTTEEPSTEEPVAESVTLTATEIYKIAAAYTVEVSVTGNGFTATGSGFFISTDGQVVTNYHVIDDATEITVTDYSGNTYTVTQILAYDEDMDIAVLKVDAKTTAAVLNKELPETGDTIYTLGSSKSLTDTFSDGIVSNPARVIEEVNPDMEYIQITAPISNGNSGGPLINNKGEVIGINSMGYTSGQNINFAIPVKYLDELDYSNPLTIDEFVQLSIPDGCIVASTYSVNLKPGGSGCIQIQLVDLPSDSTVVFQSSTNAINCEWSDWYYNNSTKLTDTTFLYISAIDTVSDGYILIYIKDYPTIQIKITVNISAYGSSLYAFGDTACPDFGAYTGVAPVLISLSDNAEIISFAYYATDLSAAGKVASTVFTGYTTYLDSYGFSLYKTESKSQNGKYYNNYYYLNKSTGELILLSIYYTNSERSVIKHIIIAIG